MNPLLTGFDVPASQATDNNPRTVHALMLRLIPDVFSDYEFEHQKGIRVAQEGAHNNFSGEGCYEWEVSEDFDVDLSEAEAAVIWPHIGEELVLARRNDSVDGVSISELLTARIELRIDAGDRSARVTVQGQGRYTK